MQIIDYVIDELIIRLLNDINYKIYLRTKHPNG